MTMIDLGESFADFKEADVAPEGLYPLRIVNVKATMPKEGEPVNGDPKGWSVMLTIDEGNYKPFNHWLPNTGHPANAHWVDNAVKNLRGFMKLFDVEPSREFNPEDLVGVSLEQATVLVEESEYQGEITSQNRVKIPMV
jgi:hypothetical protein